MLRSNELEAAWLGFVLGGKAEPSVNTLNGPLLDPLILGPDGSSGDAFIFVRDFGLVFAVRNRLPGKG